MVKVIFIHPDLGIGGAERLVVDAALALKDKGHDVEFFTAHHDTSHCFPETKDPSQLKVTVIGDWFMPRSIFGKCAALCAYLRMIVVAFYVVLVSGIHYDVVFCDQISVCIPVFKYMKPKTRVVFYCHFPDMLLTERKHWLKSAYRLPLDYLEEITTGMAHTVMVNSQFTAGIFRDTFKRLSVELKIVYPSVNTSAFDKPVDSNVSGLKLENWNVKHVFLSINRYERKKNIGLAINAMARLKKTLPSDVFQSCFLIIAGGYDSQNQENISHFAELEKLALKHNLNKENLVFLRSVSDREKRTLLHSCTCLLYTPDHEHFGIVPVEAMLMSRPVIAVNSGGPMETIEHSVTGFLSSPNEVDFANYMEKIVKDKDMAREMGVDGRARVLSRFAYSNFRDAINDAVVGVKD